VGKAFAQPTSVATEDPRYRIVRGRGRIEVGGFQDETRYELHVDDSGRPMLVQFEEHPDDLADGTVIRLTLDNGRLLYCQVVGDSPLCSIVRR
jgi:hypothetical protein